MPRPPSGVSHSSENLDLQPVPKIHNTQSQGPNKVGQVSQLSSSNKGSSQTPVTDAVYDVEAATVSLKQEKPKSGRKSRRVQIHDVETGLESLESKKSKSPRKRGKIKQMMTVGMRLKKGILHIVSNSVMPGSDVSSDFLTFLELLSHGDTRWAIAVLFFMFVPFFFKLAEFVVDLCKGNVKENNVAGLFLHLPFVAPIVHLSLGLRIMLIDPTKPENLSSIEKVAKVAALGSMYEAFLESGPQLQLQQHIILSTGRPTKTQLVSIILSTLSLTLASCRAFFVQRSREFADPEPNIHMTLRVFPYMLIQVYITRAVLSRFVVNYISYHFCKGAVSLLGVVSNFNAEGVCLRCHSHLRLPDLALHLPVQGKQDKR